MSRDNDDGPVLCSRCALYTGHGDHATPRGCIDALRAAVDFHERQYTAPCLAVFESDGQPKTSLIAGDSLKVNAREGAVPVMVFMLPGEEVTVPAFDTGHPGTLKRTS